MSAIARHLLPDGAGIDADGALTIGGIRLSDLARTYGTPLFVYDESHLRARCREAVAALGADSVVYAAKAFLCRAMARLAHDEGVMLDVATGGELHVALAAGVPASRCVLHGNNKSEDELRVALAAGVRHVVVDCTEEFERIERLVSAGLPVPRVQVRVTPGVYVHTHEFVSTGQDDSKFGFNLRSGAADEAIARARVSSAMEFVGVHCHIGSNVFAVDNFTAATAIMVELANRVEAPELTMGGGLGVAYVEAERAPSITQWASVLRESTSGLRAGTRLLVEPGRSIVAGAAVTVYTVGAVKEIPGVRTYVAVDGGMSDNPRPVLYGSGYEAFVPDRARDERARRVRVVGKHCESGDVLIAEADVPVDLVAGDLLATPVTGAYGHSMGSNYNKVSRPPVVFVRDGRARVVVRRETLDDLLALDVDDAQ